MLTGDGQAHSARRFRHGGCTNALCVCPVVGGGGGVGGGFFFNDTAPTGIYTLSLHDALPISYAKK